MHGSSDKAVKGPVRIAIVDDHAAVRLGLERVLAREPGFRVVAALDGARDLIAVVSSVHVDVVVLDYELARGDGLAVCQRLKLRGDPPAVVIYSAYAGAGLIVPAAIAQADAIVNKAEPVSVLLDVIRRVARGESLIQPPPLELLAAATARVDPRDAPLVPLLAHGASIPEIADALALDGAEVLRRARRIVGRLRAASDAPSGRPRHSATGRWGRGPIAAARGLFDG
jgi:DNA-binding NarL/FixJ family response regulator